MAKLLEERKASRKAAQESRPIPFGEEELAKRDAQNRLRKMSREQLQNMVKEKDLDFVMRIVGGKHG